MDVWCGLAFNDLKERRHGVIVFPEGVSRQDISAAETAYPEAIIVGVVVVSVIFVRLEYAGSASTWRRLRSIY